MKRLLFIITLLISVKCLGQETVILETDQLIMFTLPSYYTTKSLPNDVNETFTKWINCRCDASSKTNRIIAYTIQRMDKHGDMELKKKWKNVKRTEFAIWPELEDIDPISVEHQKWFRWDLAWCKKTYLLPSGLYRITFVSHTTKHMIIFAFETNNVNDSKEFDEILRTIDYKKKNGFLTRFYNFHEDHTLLFFIYFAIVLILLFAFNVFWLTENPGTAIILCLFPYILMMIWLLFALHWDWLFVGTSAITLFVFMRLIFIGFKD